MVQNVDLRKFIKAKVYPFDVIKIDLKKSNWKIFSYCFGIFKQKGFLLKKRYLFYYYFFLEQFFSLFISRGCVSFSFFSFLFQFFKKKFFINGVFFFLNVLFFYLIPFLLRSIKVAGRFYDIPMLTSLDSQYNLLFRFLFRFFTKAQKTYSSFFLLSLIKLSFFREGFLQDYYISYLKTSISNQRFLRYRWT
jgi:hypothetical protein